MVIASLLPVMLWGHGAEYLGAKFQFDGDGRSVILELTADYGANPLVESEKAAAEVVTHLLSVWRDGTWAPLVELAPCELRSHHRPDPSSPLPSDPTDTTIHQLLTATWRWQPPAGVRDLCFRVSDELQQPVIFWIHGPQLARDQQKWAILYSGEDTPPIPLPESESSMFWLSVSAIIGMLAALTFVRRFRNHHA